MFKRNLAFAASLATALLINTAATTTAWSESLNPKTVPGLTSAHSIAEWTHFFNQLRAGGMEPNTLGGLRAANENLFVFTIQTLLGERGFYNGPVNGRMTKPTIDAIMAYCDSAKIADKCKAGPMDWGVAYFLAYALIPYGTKLPLTADAKPEPVAPATTAAVAAPAVPTGPALPEGWQSMDRDGVAHQVVSLADADGMDYADIRYTGTPQAKGNFNLRLSEPTPVQTGQTVTAILRAGLASGAGDTLRLALRVTLRDAAGAYVGELDAAGTPLQLSADAPQDFTISGTVPDGVATIQPYIQLAWNAGATIDETLRIFQPKLTIGAAQPAAAVEPKS